MANTQMQPGVTYPSMSSMSGASPRSSAISAQAGSNAKLSSLNSIAGGGVVVPQVSTSYTQQNGSQGPSSQMTSLTATGGQQYQNSVYDAGALKKGGKMKTFGNRIGKRIGKTFGKRLGKRIGKTFGNRIGKRMNNKRFDNRMNKTKKRIHKKKKSNKFIG